MFVSARCGGGCVLLSASYDWRVGTICGVVLVIVTRCSAVTGGGCHKLTMASSTELTACSTGVCVGVFSPDADEPVPSRDNIGLIELASPPSVNTGHLSAISDSLRSFYRLCRYEYTTRWRQIL